MRRSALAALLALATIGLVTGCQSPQAKQAATQESKQEQLKKAEEHLGVMQTAYLENCPLANIDTGKENQSPKCKQLMTKIEGVQQQVKTLTMQVAAE